MIGIIEIIAKQTGRESRLCMRILKGKWRSKACGGTKISQSDSNNREVCKVFLPAQDNQCHWCLLMEEKIFLNKITPLLSRLIHSKQLTLHFYFNLITIYKQMKIGTILKNRFRFSTKPNPFENFLSSTKTELTMKRNPGRNSLGSEIHVPNKKITREEALEFFEAKNIKDRTVLVNVDSSHLLGMKRLVSLENLNTNVYKGNSQPVDILHKHNPSTFVAIEELMFEHGVFGMTDPLFIEKAAKEKMEMRQLFREIEEYYGSNLDRGVQRLENEYLVPPQYLHIIQTAYNLGNRIYFIGLNEYELRSLLTSYLSLNQLKILFMESLKYSAGIKSISSAVFHHKSKELLWKMHYSYLQPINHQLISKMRQKLKGFCFAHSYHFLQPENAAINFKNLKDKEPDNVKLQKNAILEVLFGNIWTKPYTNNPFPYLSEPYLKLTPEDKKLVISLYNSFYNKYKGAKDTFRNALV